MRRLLKNALVASYRWELCGGLNLCLSRRDYRPPSGCPTSALSRPATVFVLSHCDNSFLGRKGKTDSAALTRKGKAVSAGGEEKEEGEKRRGREKARTDSAYS